MSGWRERIEAWDLYAITDAELAGGKPYPEIVANLPSVPVRPLLQEDAQDYEMFERWKGCPWVLEIHRYTDLDDLLPSLGEKVIEPAAKMAQELQKR